MEKLLFLNHVGLMGASLVGAPLRLDLRPSRSPCFWGHVGPLQAMLGPLGLRETYVGQFLGPFLRAKNSVIFSAKKLGLEQPMLGLFWVALGPCRPCWGHLGPTWDPMLGNFWARFFALKSVIFSAKKLGLEQPMLAYFESRGLVGGHVGAILGLRETLCWAIFGPLSSR